MVSIRFLPARAYLRERLFQEQIARSGVVLVFVRHKQDYNVSLAVQVSRVLVLEYTSTIAYKSTV